MFTFNPLTVQVITSVILPVVLGLVMRATWPTRIKTVVGMVASAAGSLILNAVNESGFAVVSQEMLVTAVVGLVIQVSTYLGIYQNFEVNDNLPNAPVVPSRLDHRWQRRGIEDRKAA